MYLLTINHNNITYYLIKYYLQVTKTVKKIKFSPQTELIILEILSRYFELVIIYGLWVLILIFMIRNNEEVK